MGIIIKRLLSRFWPTGVLFISGFILIIYIALGFVYLQQGAQKRAFQKQINQLASVSARPLASSEELQAEYEEVNRALAPMTDQDAIATLVRIADESGIDIDVDSGKLRVPSASFRQANVGGGSYRVISFNGVYVQGDYDDVVAFISDLESGKTLETMVLKRVDISMVTVEATGEEGARRAEFRNVVAAVVSMMDDNGLWEIPNPLDFDGGVAINLMGDDPGTEAAVEGFPDISTTAAEKGYSGNVTPRDGYVLYEHDRISTDNTTQFETVSYITTLTSNYYYTCEADGTVRQFGKANVVTATEYLGSEEFKVELRATMDVDIYTKPEG